ncbi:DIS3-like exonuclease 2 isoform X2 [Vespa crabro]|uniref:DIS3-like exonuclease 2 isoform X2 n=1 Tax=Vespa crabro TaxID=7445 RepID=UPI001F00BBC6|nr:DIS3-like exonuclease 2 isoform X2 [Vespa crabro]
MTSKLESVIKTKRERQRNQYYKKKINEEKYEDIEPILSEFFKLSIQNEPKRLKRKKNFIKFIQDNSTKKFPQNMTKSRISVADEQNRTRKMNKNDINIKPNVFPSLQKESDKLFIKKVKPQPRKRHITLSEKEINDKIKQKKDTLIPIKCNMLSHNGKASSNNLCEQKQKSIKKLQKFVKPIKLEDKFQKFIPITEMKKLLKSQDPTNLKYVEGSLRINPTFGTHAYINMPNGENDLLIIGLCDRNRAFDGDLVVARINEEEKWHKGTNEQKQKTGTIVCILERIHPRKAVGILKQSDSIVLLQPRDIRLPMIKIHLNTLPEIYNIKPSLFKEILFLVNITAWKKPSYAVGKIEHMLGTAGDMEVELNAILLENDINIEPFNKELLKELPSAENILTSMDINEREDWRNVCIFTIDPATAVDLDDAVSCTVLKNGNYEVGVHISDVTHYLKYSSPLDMEVAKRATTVYLVNQVYHMMPQELCKLCSLLPGENKLTFSVIWEITPDAQIVKHHFAKTIINSCCQMTYKQAQNIIDNPEYPNIDDTLDIKGNFTLFQICEVIKNLHNLSEQMRIRRYANGALKIDQPKLHILFNKTSGLPTSYDILENIDSNRLIEEFMLLANMTVATHLYKTMPEYALLRSHSYPSERFLTLTRNLLQRFGIHLDIASSGDLYSSIKRYESCIELESEAYMYLTRYRLMVINNLCLKAMTRAKYRSSKVTQVDDLRHYALNVPYYTHFTSPIRRYPDCVVHRLLHSTISLNVELAQNWSSELCSKIAKNCNWRKYYAKRAEEQVRELYFTCLINMIGSMTVIGIVLDVKQYYIEAILCDTGIKVKVELKEIKNRITIEYKTEHSVPILTITWKESHITQNQSKILTVKWV